MSDAFQKLKDAVGRGDGASLRTLFTDHPELKTRIHDPVFSFDSPAIVAIAGRANREAIDALLEAGADINARSKWWAGSFGVLDSAKPEIAAYCIERGALLDIHSAARLGMLDKVKDFVARDPASVHARGGDGKSPLHFASTVEVAAYLLDHGAGIDMRDIDHESTAAQYLVGDRPDVVRYLIGRGCQTDILMAARLGDTALVRQHLHRDPQSIHVRVDEHYFPKQNPRSGGCIYIWTLGASKTVLQLARESGSAELLEFLMSRGETTPELRLINACWAGDEKTARELLAADPALVSKLSPADRHQVTDAAEANNTLAVRTMLQCGWPVDGDHGFTPLHFAAWNGNLEMVRTILVHNPPLDNKDPQYNATPLGWAIHGSQFGPNRQTADYPGVIQALRSAGAE